MLYIRYYSGDDGGSLQATYLTDPLQRRDTFVIYIPPPITEFTPVGRTHLKTNLNAKRDKSSIYTYAGADV